MCHYRVVGVSVLKIEHPVADLYNCLFLETRIVCTQKVCEHAIINILNFCCIKFKAGSRLHLDKTPVNLLPHKNIFIIIVLYIIVYLHSFFSPHFPFSAHSEWLVNQHRDTFASYIGHHHMLEFFAVAENESKARVKFNFLQVYTI